MQSRTLLAAGGLLITLATITGAFGAHALKETLTPERLVSYETAVRYQFYHALGLLILGVVAQTLDSRTLRWSAGLITMGIVLFSGSIYALSFGAPRAIGIVTPLGGVALITGWALFIAAVLRRR